MIIERLKGIAVAPPPDLLAGFFFPRARRELAAAGARTLMGFRASRTTSAGTGGRTRQLATRVQRLSTLAALKAALPCATTMRRWRRGIWRLFRIDRQFLGCEAAVRHRGARLQ